MYSARDQSSSVGGSRRPDFSRVPGSSRPNPVNCRGTASFDLPSNLEMKLAINHLSE